jgi:DNA-binding MarR family transcriptional regulator
MIADLQRAVHLAGLQIEHVAGDLSVTQAEAHVLAQLARQGAQTVGDLQRGFGHKRSTLTSVLDRLEMRGLIERTANPRDRRSIVIALTPAGDEAALRVERTIEDLERAIRRRVTAADIAGVHAVAAALAELAQHASIRPQ